MTTNVVIGIVRVKTRFCEDTVNSPRYNTSYLQNLHKHEAFQNILTESFNRLSYLQLKEINSKQKRTQCKFSDITMLHR